MKVLFIYTNESHAGGAEVYMNQVQRELIDRSIVVGNLGIDYSPCFPFVSRSSCRKVEAFVTTFKPSIIHFNKGICLPNSMIRKFRQLGIPIFLTVHDYYSSPFSKSIRYKFFKIFGFNAVSSADKFIIPSLRYFEDISNNYSVDLTYVPHFVDERQWYETPNKKETEQLELLFVGRLAHQKGIFLLLEAFEIFNEKFPASRLTIIGDGEEKDRLHKAIIEKNLEDVVRTVGFVPRDGLRTYYENSDILVMPSLFDELFGLVGVEAIMCGLPVVASDCKGIMEWCFHEETGLLFERGNAIDLANQLERLANDTELYAFIKSNAKKRIALDYSRTKATSKLIELYSNAIES